MKSLHPHTQNRIMTTSTRTTDKQRNGENNSSGQLKFFHNISIEKQDKPNTESAMLTRDTHTHTHTHSNRNIHAQQPEIDRSDRSASCSKQGRRDMRIVNKHRAIQNIYFYRHNSENIDTG